MESPATATVCLDILLAVSFSAFFLSAALALIGMAIGMGPTKRRPKKRRNEETPPEGRPAPKRIQDPLQ